MKPHLITRCCGEPVISFTHYEETTQGWDFLSSTIEKYYVTRTWQCSVNKNHAGGETYTTDDPEES